MGFVLANKDISDFDRDFSITQEIDRLTISGRFKRGEDVDIIMYQNMKNMSITFLLVKSHILLCV